jgi:hypothetical protein
MKRALALGADMHFLLRANLTLHSQKRIVNSKW